MASRPRSRDGGYPDAHRLFSQGKAGPVVLLAGPERVYSEDLIAILAAKLVPAGMEAFNFNRYRAGQDSLEAILNAAGTLPMFADRRLVILSDADLLSRGELDRLAEYIAAPSASTVLVVTTEETPDKAPAALKKIPERYALWRPFPKDAVAWAISRARQLGKELRKDVAEELFALCAGDSGDGRASLSDLASEIEKLSLSIGERKRIEPDDLKVVSRHAEARVLYQIESAVAERKLPEALNALSAALLFPRENGMVRIVALLGERFRKMLVARDRMQAGYSVQAVVAGMWFPGPNGSTQFLNSVKLFRRSELSQAIVDLARFDIALKTGEADLEVLHMEALLRKICVGAGMERAAV
jgi:DNA polymerase III subunit delta